jgi:hypothetical protein
MWNLRLESLAKDNGVYCLARTFGGRKISVQNDLTIPCVLETYNTYQCKMRKWFELW